MKVLSLFDGMACGMLAMQSAGVSVDRYVAFEIDNYAVQTSAHNFPMIEHRGDVFKADFTEFSGFDFLVGGSPCTYWSIAQKNNRETEASGMGWELFSQYVRALHEAKPKWFIYENNKSMSKAIRESIDRAFGFEAVCINSALVSAQNRQRLYWVGMRNEDGSYSKVRVDQPEDRGILLKDVLDGMAWRDKAYTIDSNYHKTLGQQGFDRQSGRRKMVAEPVNIAQNEKSHTLKAQYYKNGVANFVTNGGFDATAVAEPVNVTADGKAQCLRATYYKDGIRNIAGNNVDKKTGVSEPVACRCRGRVDGNGIGYAKYECREDGKANTLDTNTTNGSMVAIPVEFDDGVPVKAISCADGKTYPVYEVKDGQITIKGKQYPIKLADGYYIIRKLTVSECKRLQTVPEWYEFPVSDTQAYKMLGNGWTVEVISHILSFVDF
jgi:DNA (cytosine-5)-methyltransferase 3A